MCFSLGSARARRLRQENSRCTILGKLERKVLSMRSKPAFRIHHACIVTFEFGSLRDGTGWIESVVLGGLVMRIGRSLQVRRASAREERSTGGVVCIRGIHPDGRALVSELRAATFSRCEQGGGMHSKGIRLLNR